MVGTSYEISRKVTLVSPFAGFCSWLVLAPIFDEMTFVLRKHDITSHVKLVSGFTSQSKHD